MQGGFKIQVFIFQEVANFRVLQGRNAIIQQFDFFRNDIERHHFMLLRKNHGIGKANITCTDNTNFHNLLLFCDEF